jgi:membrane protease YdiL (CAAX protease family)
MSAAAGSLRAAALLIRLRARQQLNHLLSVYRHRFGGKKRTGTGRKARGGWMGAFVGTAMLFGIGNLAHQSVDNMERVARRAETGQAARAAAPSLRSPGREAGQPGQGAGPARGTPQAAPAPRIAPPQVAPAPGSAWTPGVLRAATFLASMAMLAALFITLASREILRSEWELEWLVTLPLRLSTLIWCRIAERAFTNGAVMIVLTPIFTIMAWRCGHILTAPLYGIALTVPVLVVVATLHTLFDTGLRVTLAPSRLRNLHAAISILSPLPLLVVTGMGLPDSTLVFGLVDKLPDWAAWLPGGLAVRALAATDIAAAAQWLGLMLAEAAAVTVAGVLLLQRQMRNGVVAAGAREAARHPVVRERAPTVAAGRTGPSLLSPVQRRELRLLGRDRSFMVQTLFLPLMMVGAQLVLNVQADIFTEAVRTPSHLAAVAFGLAAYTLMFSAFQTLNAEGQSLWILFCLPHSLESILRQKAVLWGTVATLYAVAVFGVAIGLARDVSWPLAGQALIVLVGVPVFAVIATALGVFGCDPLEQDVQKRVRITYLYLYMLIASFYAYAIYATTFWARLGTMVLTALVALALWQKARDRFPFLLDPGAAPPARVSLADGLIAALMFFVLQALISLLALAVATDKSRTLTPATVWVAFATGGAITYAVMRLIYWRAQAAGVPRVLGPHLLATALWGLGGGAVAAAGGLAYITAARMLDRFPALRDAGHLADPATLLWIGSLAVVAAPIFEEFIFRGLIFGGLRRSLGFAAAAVASAAIFAVVHPPASVVPVFGLGLCTAFVYERTRTLAGPMIVHATYNAAVVALQWNLMQQSV